MASGPIFGSFGVEQDLAALIQLHRPFSVAVKAEDQGTSSESLAVIDNMSLNVPANFRCPFEFTLHCSTTSSADGISLDLNGGSGLTITTVRAVAILISRGAGTDIKYSTSLSGALAISDTIGTDFVVKVNGFVESTTAGTIAPQVAVVSSNSTPTLTIKSGSNAYLNRGAAVDPA